MTVGKDGLGVRAPIPDSRVHVRIDPAASAAMEGQLFATEGLDFDSREEPLALYSEFTLPEGLEAGRLTGAISLGGERRLAIWHDSPSLLAGLVSPKELLETIVRDRQMRLILVTPGCFKDGWMPGWLAKDGRPPVAGCLLQMRLRAAAAGRFVPISGWDLKDRRPKPTRFLSPAGAVFFVSIDGQVTVEQLSKLWLQPVSDADQDRRDGFGLCILGAWGE
jgi:CRISPR-associated protein Cmr3